MYVRVRTNCCVEDKESHTSDPLSYNDTTHILEYMHVLYKLAHCAVQLCCEYTHSIYSILYSTAHVCETHPTSHHPAHGYTPLLDIRGLHWWEGLVVAIIAFTASR